MSTTQIKEVGMRDVLRDDELLFELPRIGAQPRAACLAAQDPQVTGANVSSYGASQLFMSGLREMSKWRTG
jgi:hypothetical protein